MATATGRTHCETCGKERATAKCAGCFKDFCFNHLQDHRQELNKRFDGIEVSRDLFQQTLIQQTNDIQNHPLMQMIDEWEQNSIYKIRQAAEEIKLSLVAHAIDHVAELEQKLVILTDQLLQSRQEDDIIETDLQKWEEELTQLREEFNRPTHITIQQSPVPLINKIHINISIPILLPNISVNAKWAHHGITVAGSQGQGSGLNQLSDPWSVCISDDQTIYIADRSNHRIVEWKNDATEGQIVAGGNGQGSLNNQLNRPVNVIVDKENDCLIISDYGNKRVVRWPRRNGSCGCGETIISNVSCWGLTMDGNRNLYVSDVNKHEVRRYERGDPDGIVVAGGNGRGKRLDQLNGPYYIFVDQENSVYVPDCNNHRVMKWVQGAKKGIVVAGDQDYGYGMTELSGPFSVIVDQLGTLYVADGNNNRVMRWLKGAAHGSIIAGGNGTGKRASQFNSPCDLAFDAQNNLYVIDNSNHRLQKFNIDPNSTT